MGKIPKSQNHHPVRTPIPPTFALDPLMRHNINSGCPGIVTELSARPANILVVARVQGPRVAVPRRHQKETSVAAPGPDGDFHSGSQPWPPSKLLSLVAIHDRCPTTPSQLPSWFAAMTRSRPVPSLTNRRRWDRAAATSHGQRQWVRWRQKCAAS